MMCMQYSNLSFRRINHFSLKETKINLWEKNMCVLKTDFSWQLLLLRVINNFHIDWNKTWKDTTIDVIKHRNVNMKLPGTSRITILHQLISQVFLKRFYLSRTIFWLLDGNLVLDSWLVSLNVDHNRKWIHHRPCLQQKAASNQNQRFCSLTCGSGFLRWIKCCSSTFCVREDKWV